MLCPNCHSVVHRLSKIRGIGIKHRLMDKLKAFYTIDQIALMLSIRRETADCIRSTLPPFIIWTADEATVKEIARHEAFDGMPLEEKMISLKDTLIMLQQKFKEE